MKKLTAILLAAALLLSAASCGGNTSAPAADSTGEVISAPEVTPAATETADPEETTVVTVVDIPQEKIEGIRETLSYFESSMPDLYGWIFIDGTEVDYPVVQSGDNDFYLNMSPEQTYQEIGSIFADFRNGKDVATNRNTVLYGHNLTWGGMFHDVQNFFENEEIFRNTLIYIYTIDGICVFEPFSVYEANAYYQYFRTDFEDEADFVAFANEVKSNSVWETDVTLTAEDRLITLSTCTNRDVDGRYALHGRLVQVSK